MKAKIIILENQAEFEQSEKLGMNVAPKLMATDFLFRIQDVADAFRAKDGNIHCTINGHTCVLLSDDSIWTLMVKYFEIIN